ncbi:DNA-binding transcriptional LysR family regulator [Chromohalobacter marismortui]|uniref:DNA-binding transcriptional LysR family regulator n=1 Tax=Chromohalobacter marismortui TaxID=42055 RepID=A0A4R7NUH0_9GAMM|nr:MULTISPECIES: LysR family transcriptional regulator [Chromohalobacter]MCI0510766.1 LysR family transcriptional regulator [Chromohalobacter sp.]MCI0593541.1 LysR family transcriptional regulator [Chromohalobacter sp.]TDU24657.1 DNA-binding transcriptional LysR family regulator [Chromohalobacter marismortui]
MVSVTLAQWRMLAAVVDHGGFARAAEAVHKSPSTLNHAVHKLEEQLGVRVLEPVGRQVRLTEAGDMLLRRARQLLESAEALEDVAGRLGEGLEAEVVIAVDQIFPPDALAQALDSVSRLYPHVRVQLHETVLNGGVEMLYDGRADLVVSGIAAQGFLGEPLVNVEFLAVSHPGHPLQHLGRELDLRDLEQHRQLVVRDSALRQSMDAGWLKAEQRWTVSHLVTSFDMLCRGLGFAWMPITRIREALRMGRLVPLPLALGGRREVSMQLIFRDRDRAGPATRALAAALHEAVSGCCDEHSIETND